MKRIALTVVLSAGFVGSAAAQGPENLQVLLNNLDNTVNGLVEGPAANRGLDSSLIASLNGELVNDNGDIIAPDYVENTLTDVPANLFTGTLVGTPLEGMELEFIAAGRDLGQQLVNAGLPLFEALDGPAGQLADAGAPLSDPAIVFLEELEFNLVLDTVIPDPTGGAAGGLPGLGDVGLPGLGDAGLPELPGLGDAGLPALPGLGDAGLPALPGLGSLTDLLMLPNLPS